MDLKKIKNGFTILELIIALGLIMMIWGSAGILLKRVLKETKNIFREERGKVNVFTTKLFEKESTSLLERIQGTSSKLVLETLKGKIVFEYHHGKIYRLESNRKKIILENLKSMKWKYLSQGQWFDRWVEKQLPDAIIWIFNENNNFLKLVCPLYKEGTS